MATMMTLSLSQLIDLRSSMALVVCCTSAVSVVCGVCSVDIMR